MTENFEKIMQELKVKQVSDAIKDNPCNWRSRLEEIGFTMFDDEDEDSEETEEAQSKPENINQEFLADYFNCDVKMSDAVLDAFNTERDSDTPNYPLFRRYFKSGNDNLKQLILYGLDKYPTDIDLLNDLAYFHEHHNLLSELIDRFMAACEMEQDFERFNELATNFYCYTEPDGYDALYELAQRFPKGSPKSEVVQIIRDQLYQQEQNIEF